MDTDASTGTDHRDPLASDDARPLVRYVIGSGYRIGDNASFAQDDAFRNTHQVTGRHDHVLSKGAIYLRPNIALVVDTQCLPSRGAHNTVATEEVKRAGDRVALMPTLSPGTGHYNGPRILMSQDARRRPTEMPQADTFQGQASATRYDAHQHLAWSRLRHGSDQRLERSPKLFKYYCSHLHGVDSFFSSSSSAAVICCKGGRTGPPTIPSRSHQALR